MSSKGRMPGSRDEGWKQEWPYFPSLMRHAGRLSISRPCDTELCKVSNSPPQRGYTSTWGIAREPLNDKPCLSPGHFLFLVSRDQQIRKGVTILAEVNHLISRRE